MSQISPHLSSHAVGTDLVPGMRLDRYEIVCKISRGGMASVWVARLTGSHGFERLFALKTILPDLAADESMRTMFLDEANIASRIEHPNVARVFELGETNGILYQVMEWVDGESLSYLARTQRNAAQAFPLGIALRVAADACLGLHAAHEQKDTDGKPRGVVHRDVSPQNILVSRDGIVKVIDFGIAKALDRATEETRTGFLKGKLKYMAPEQALKLTVDRRADIFSMGAVLYGLLRGAAPHGDAESVHILSAMLQGQGPDPLPDTVPEPVRAVVARAMSFEPEDRYATGVAMAQDLERVMIACGCPATAVETAAFVAAHAGERLAERSASIRSNLESLSRARPLAAAPGAPRPSDGFDVLVDLGDEPPTPKPRMALIAAGVIAVVGLLVTGVAVAMHGGSPAAAVESTAATHASVSPTAAATPSVTVATQSPATSAVPSATASTAKIARPPGTKASAATPTATAATTTQTSHGLHMTLE